MKLWRSVVGKLWMTIIGLVAVVLMINSMFIWQFLNTNFSNSKDQERIMLRLAERASQNLYVHQDEEHYLNAFSEILAAQEAAMIVLDSDLREAVPAQAPPQLVSLQATDLFTPPQLREVLGGKSLFSVYTDPRSGNKYVAVAVPYDKGEQGPPHGVVLLYQAQIQLNYTETYFQRLFAIAGIIGFLLTTFFAFFLSSRVSRPLLEMKKAAAHIAMGEYKMRVPVVTTDEIGELAKAFNQMTSRLDETIHALNHEKSQMSSVLRSMTDAVLSFDAEGKIILANPHGEKVIEQWRNIPWDGAANGDEPSQGAMQVPAPLRSMYESVMADKQEKTATLHVQTNVYSVDMAPLYTADEARGAVAVLRNVTEEYKVDKLRKDFVANVSHELRTPLSMLQGYSEALLDDIASTPEERKELAQIIHDESLRMGRLVQDLLDLARMESGKLDLHFREVELRTMLRRVYRKFFALSKERGLEFELDMPENDTILHSADEDRLEQVMTNLLDNAIRHTPAGGRISVKVRAVREAGRDWMRIDVEDTGQGIPPEDLPFIFERFYKADKARKRGSSGGTGLGLAIVKNIVDAHRGTIDAASEPGKGTTFMIKLPNDPT